jgi:pimeloyl-ACP methyl ester carboxylesterase
LPSAFWLAVALALSLPTLCSGWILLTSASFLAEFLSEGRWRPLSAITCEVCSRPLAASAGGHVVPADLYVGTALARPSGLVLVHGLSPAGKDDPRLGQAASLLAKNGWAVAVPTVEGLTTLRLRPDDATAVVAVVHALEQAGYRPVAILGISLGAAPAMLAAADPSVRSSVSAVMALGGYASIVELLRYTLTGAYRFDGVSGRQPVNEVAIAEFASANAELVGPPGRRLVENRDAEALDRLVAELPPDTQRLLAGLSPEQAVARIRAPLFLIHGRDDPAVPFTESLRLERAARAAGRQVRTVIVGSLVHVEPENRAGPLDLARLWAGFYAFRIASGRLTSADRGS